MGYPGYRVSRLWGVLLTIGVSWLWGVLLTIGPGMGCPGSIGLQRCPVYVVSCLSWVLLTIGYRGVLNSEVISMCTNQNRCPVKVKRTFIF